MKFSTSILLTALASATLLPSFVNATKESNPSIGIVGRDESKYTLLWKPSQEEEHGLFNDIDTINSCANEEYELKLVVHAQPHAFFMSIPMDDETMCPPLLWHADFVDPMKKNVLEKSIHAIDDIDDKHVFEHDLKLVETISVGNYLLKEIAEAFHNADDGNDKPYDSVTNNCGLLLVNMGTYLNVDYYSNPELVAYVQRHLIQQDGPNTAHHRLLGKASGESAELNNFFDWWSF